MYDDDYACAGSDLLVEIGKEFREARVKALSPLEMQRYSQAGPQVLQGEHTNKPGVQEHAPEECIHISYGKIGIVRIRFIELCMLDFLQ